MAVTNAVQPAVRSALATSVDGSGGGLVPFIPVNLIGVSSDFGNAAWAKTRLTVSSNAAIGPRGGMTAEKLIASVDAGDHKTFKGVGGVTNGQMYTFSVYLKQAEYTWVILYNATGKGRYFDLANGVVGSAFISTPPFATITPAANGYFRCSISTLTTYTVTTNFIYLATSDGVVSFTGNTIDGIFADDAQLEIGDTVNTFVPAL